MLNISQDSIACGALREYFMRERKARHSVYEFGCLENIDSTYDSQVRLSVRWGGGGDTLDPKFESEDSDRKRVNKEIDDKRFVLWRNPLCTPVSDSIILNGMCSVYCTVVEFAKPRSHASDSYVKKANSHIA